MGCIALVRCVLVWHCGLAGVVWYQYAGESTSAHIRIPHHPSQTTMSHQHTSNQSNTTHEITHQISRKLLRIDVLTSETCWALNNEIIKQVTSSWSLFIQLSNVSEFILQFKLESSHQNYAAATRCIKINTGFSPRKGIKCRKFVWMLFINAVPTSQNRLRLPH